MKNKPLIKMSALAAMGLLVVVTFAGLSTTAVDYTKPAGYWFEGYKWQVPLFAGQDIEVGSVTVWLGNDDYIYVVYEMENGWELTDTHIAIVTGDCDEIDGSDFPTTKSLNPKVGHFPYTVEDFPIAASDVGYDEGDSICFATHAVVQKPDGCGGYETQTGWAGDHDFGGKSWAVYFCYEPRKIPDFPGTADIKFTYPDTESYWNAYVVFDGTYDNMESGTDYLCFCAQGTILTMSAGWKYALELMNSYDYYNGGTGITTANWYKINWICDYIMDHPGTFTPGQIQNAIWYYTEYSSTTNGLTVLADSYGGDYYPADGDWMAIFVKSQQPTIIIIDP